jgi:hypothetical protein
MQQDQPTRIGRRLAAIVAADVAGYSRLMGLDEVGTAPHAPRTSQGHRCTRGEARGTPREEQGFLSVLLVRPASALDPLADHDGRIPEVSL